MFLALREMRRAAVRFLLLTGAIGLLVFLILFQQSLQNGLLTSFIGAIENQSAPVLVYSVDGRRNLQGSVITPDLEEQIRQVDGVGDVSLLGQGTFSVRADDALTTAAVIGYSDPELGAPETVVEGRLPDAPGEAVALDSAAEDGFDVGDTVTVEPGGEQIRIVGLAEQIGYQASTTLFTDYDTFSDAVTSANPDARGVLPAVLALSPAEGVSDEQLVSRINDEVADADALTRADAAAETPGVAQVRQSFQVIFLLYGMVVPLISGLFFLIITLQKAGALTLLRAVGVQAPVLVRSLLFQVTLVMAAGLAIGIALYLPLSSQRLGGIQLSFETGAVIVWSVLLLGLGVLSALFAARRVLRIDPIDATTGAGVST